MQPQVMQLQEREIKHHGSSLVCYETKNTLLSFYLFPFQAFELKYRAVCFTEQYLPPFCDSCCRDSGRWDIRSRKQQPDALALFPDSGWEFLVSYLLILYDIPLRFNQGHKPTKTSLNSLFLLRKSRLCEC